MWKKYQDIIASLESRIQDFQDEARLSKLGSDLGISPRIYDSFICDNVLKQPEGGHLITMGFIIMDRWDMSAGKWRQNNPGAKISYDLIKQLENKINIMHNNGIFHGDLHLENIMLRLGPDGITPIDIAIIDFGSAAGFAKNLKPDEIEFAKQKDLDIAAELIYMGLTSFEANDY